MTTFRAVVFVAFCCAVSLVQAAPLPTYALTNLGVLPDMYRSDAYGISPTTGQVVGRSIAFGYDNEANFVYTPQDGLKEIVIDTPRDVRLLADHINDVGQIGVTGYSATGQYYSYVWHNGQTTRLGNPASSTRLRALNNQGVGVGYWTLPDRNIPFVWNANAGLTRVDVIESPDQLLFDINDLGLAVGIYKVDEGYRSYTLDTATNTVTDLGNFGYLDSTYLVPRAINDQRQIVAQRSWDSRSYFIDEQGEATELGSLIHPNDPDKWGGVYAHDLNDQGIVVGQADTSQGDHGFRWDASNGLIDLNTLLPPQSGWTITDVRAIDEAGRIVGTGSHEGHAYAVILTPVPEPSTIALVSFGGLLLLLVAWRRQR